MTDKFKIDSHKYAFHPQHSSTVVNYHSDPSNEEFKIKFKNQHPKYIEVSPVGACNHRCTFCAVDYIGYKSVFMDVDKYRETIVSMLGKGCGSIMFAGEGEPLLHPKISEIVNLTKEEGKIDTSFTTNAVMLNENFVRSSLKNVSWIKVSFNAGTSSVYKDIHRTNEKDFSKVIENLKNAVEYSKKNNLQTKFGMQMLLLPENESTIHQLCEIARDIGMDYVVIKPYSQHKFSNTDKYKNIDYSKYLGLEDELKCYNSKDFNVIFRINTIKNWISQNDQRYCHCIATPSVWAYIMADGAVYSCSAYLLDERFLLGNINDQSFDQIWASEKRIKHAEFVMNELDINECRVNCRMDQINRYLDGIVNKSIEHMNFV